jgi:hypothetical protein
VLRDYLQIVGASGALCYAATQKAKERHKEMKYVGMVAFIARLMALRASIIYL